MVELLAIVIVLSLLLLNYFIQDYLKLAVVYTKSTTGSTYRHYCLFFLLLLFDFSASNVLPSFFLEPDADFLLSL